MFCVASAAVVSACTATELAAMAYEPLCGRRRRAALEECAVGDRAAHDGKHDVVLLDQVHRPAPARRGPHSSVAEGSEHDFVARSSTIPSARRARSVSTSVDASEVRMLPADVRTEGQLAGDGLGDAYDGSHCGPRRRPMKEASAGRPGNPRRRRTPPLVAAIF